MRFLMAVVLLFSGLLQGPQQKSERPCGQTGEGLATYWYHEAVLERIRPSEWQVWPISISFFPTAESKLVLRAKVDKFELLRGTPEKNIYKFLEGLDASCDLPPNPEDAVDLVKVHWDRAEIPQAKFDQIHRDFTDALSQYLFHIQSRYGNPVARGGVLHLHTSEYSVVYDNGGFEHIEVEAWDDTSDPAKMDPMIKWVREVLKLCDVAFPKN